MSTPTSTKQLERINQKGPRATLGELGKIADALDCPLWVLMLPGLSAHPHLLQGPGLHRLVSLVENYLACDDGKRANLDASALALALLGTVERITPRPTDR